MKGTRSSYTVSAAAAQWGADSTDLTPADQVQQLAPADPERRTLTIVSDPDSVGTLYLTPNPGQRRGGMRLKPGAAFEFTHGQPVYGYATGGIVHVNIVTESGAVC